MARRPTGWEALPRAMEQIKSAKTVEELCIAQAVVLPLECGLTLKDTAQVIGKTAAWVARQRRLFIEGKTTKTPPENRLARGGRRNQLLREDEEDSFMLQVCDAYIDLHKRWISDDLKIARTVSRDDVWHRMHYYVQKALQVRLGRPVPLSSVYNLMKRTAVRKFDSDKPYMWESFCKDLIWK